MSLLTPDFGLLFWMLVSFLIVFGLLAKFGFPVITRMVDERREYIRKSLENADEANRQLENVKEEARLLLDKAQSRQNEILKQAVAESEQIVRNAREKASEEAAKQIEAAKSQIETQKQKALMEIRTQVAVLSVDIAEKILRNRMDDRDAQQALISRMLDEAELIREENKTIKS